jgi:glycosyltransferase involved in cell wall biosynthesis
VKILLATYWYIPHLGGVWPLMCHIKEKLESMGHEVDILGNCNDGKGYHIVNKNLVIKKEELLPYVRAQLNRETSPELNVDRWMYDVEIDRYCMELAAAYFGLEQYDIIHTQDVISTLSISRVKPKNTPLFASFHGVLAKEIIQFFKYLNPSTTIAEIKETIKWKHYWTFDKLGGMSADLIHTSSQWTKNIFANEYGVANDRIITFQYGINIETFFKKMQLKTDVVPPQNKKVIIYTGRLVNLKGLHFLLPALSKLKQVRQDWVCWIVGDGAMKEELKKQSQDLQLQYDVLFLGSRDDVPALLNQADIFVLPSLQDNMPLSLIEAQLAGKPAVVSDAGGLPEMVSHGVTGMVARAGQSESLYNHLKKLIEDDGLRNEQSLTIKKKALKYWSIDLMTDRLLAIYKNMVNKKG